MIDFGFIAFIKNIISTELIQIALSEYPVIVAKYIILI